MYHNSMILLSCLDGGLFCVGIPVLIAILCPALGIWMKRKFKWCQKSCKCECHEKPKPKMVISHYDEALRRFNGK